MKADKTIGVKGSLGSSTIMLRRGSGRLTGSEEVSLVYCCVMCGAMIKEEKKKRFQREILHECEGLDSYRMGIAYLIGFERKEG